MPKDVVRDRKRDRIDSSHFLSGLYLVMEAHGMSWDDIDIDMEKRTINFKIDMIPEDTFKFLVDVQKKAGDFD